MKNTFRKIASVVASTTMLASTLGFAAAASFPSPFVQNGAADVAVVYGSSSSVAATDLVAVADIQTYLAQKLAGQTATSDGVSSGSSVSGGDYVKLERTSDKFNLGDSAKNVFVTDLTKDNLPVLLADGTYLDDDNNEFKYTQKVVLGTELNLTHFRDTDYSETPAIGIVLDSGRTVLNYSLEFTKQPDFTGAALVNTNLPLLGKDYYVLSVGSDSLTLLDSANTVLLNEGETQTVTVGNKNYDASIAFIGESQVKLSINGQVTNTLAVGNTYKLSDGTFVGVKDILVQNYAGGAKKVEFSLGSGKLLLENGQEVELNDDTVSGLTATITNSSGKLSRVGVTWKTDDREFITPDKELVMPGFGALKISTTGMTFPLKEQISIDKDGSNSIRLSAPIKDGTANFNILYSGSDGSLQGIGKDSNNKLITSATNQVTISNTAGNKDKWFVVSWNRTSEAESYLLSATVNLKDGQNKTTIKNEVTGQNIHTDVANGTSINVGSAVLTIKNIARTDGSNWNVVFEGGEGVTFNNLYTKEGLKISLPYSSTTNATSAVGSINFNNNVTNVAGHNNASFYLTMSEEDKDSNLANGASFYTTLKSNSDNRMHVSAVNETGLRLEETDKYETYLASALATQIVHDRTGNEYSAMVTYHGKESFADVFVSSPDSVISGGSSTGGSVKELGSVSVSDSEVSSVSGKNLIVVGGSCVNSVAADLLGGALCGADFESKTKAGAGSFLVETFSRSNGKVATLVAGYNAADTTNAAKYVTTQAVDTTVGKKYLGTSATSATLQTA